MFTTLSLLVFSVLGIHEHCKEDQMYSDYMVQEMKKSGKKLNDKGNYVRVGNKFNGGDFIRITGHPTIKDGTLLRINKLRYDYNIKKWEYLVYYKQEKYWLDENMLVSK